MTDTTQLDTDSMIEYKKLLASHDWYYMYSDDHSVYRRGEAAQNRLVSMRLEIDRDASIWNSMCPPDMAIKKLPCSNG